jgi:hypothetical protein
VPPGNLGLLLVIPLLELIKEPVASVLCVPLNVENHLTLLKKLAFNKPQSQTKDEVIFGMSATIVHDNGQLLTAVAPSSLIHPSSCSPFTRRDATLLPPFPLDLLCNHMPASWRVYWLHLPSQKH